MKENEERIKLSDQEKDLNKKLESLSEQNVLNSPYNRIA